MLALVSACGEGETAPSPTTTLPASMSTTSTTPGFLADFDRIEVEVAGESWTVALADTSALRSQGLMGVTDLGDIDGMLFTWPQDVDSGFWMKNTLIPLDIAFFAEDGSLVDLLSMVPCELDPCTSYRPSGPYRWALEVEAGGFDGLADLVLDRP